MIAESNTRIEKIKSIFAEVLNLSSIEDEGLLQKYQIDSINALEILVRVEHEFEIEIEDEDLGPDLVDSVFNLDNYISNIRT